MEVPNFLAEAKEPPALLHPEMAGYYRRQVASLHGLLERGPEIERMKATEMLRSLISAIVLTPDDTGLAIDVQGDLAGILVIATAENAKIPLFAQRGILNLSWLRGQDLNL